MAYVLLGTSGCHLCELAEALIHECQYANADFSVELIDIAEQEQWQEAFAIKIPVLLHLKSCHYLPWPFTQDDILTFIRHHYD